MNYETEVVPKQGKCHSEGAERLKNPLIRSEKWMLHFVQHDRQDFLDSLSSADKMARRNVSFTEGLFYHIYNRGVGRQNIFLTRDNYDFVLRKVSLYSEDLAVRVIAFCLMPNHYHFLLRQVGAQSAGLLVQRVFNSYTKAFNRLYSRSGTLFESPFKAKMVERNEYLGHLCWYIHMNPVAAGLVRNIEEWLYSNFLECVGKRNLWAFDPEFIADLFGSPSGYEEFVRSYEVTARRDQKLKEYFLDE